MNYEDKVSKVTMKNLRRVTSDLFTYSSGENKNKIAMITVDDI